MRLAVSSDGHTAPRFRETHTHTHMLQERPSHQRSPLRDNCCSVTALIKTRAANKGNYPGSRKHLNYFSVLCVWFGVCSSVHSKRCALLDPSSQLRTRMTVGFFWDWIYYLIGLLILTVAFFSAYMDVAAVKFKTGYQPFFFRTKQYLLLLPLWGIITTTMWRGYIHLDWHRFWI